MSKPRLTLLRETLPSPIGEIVLLSDAEGRLRALDFPDYAERMTRLLDRHYGRDGWTITPATAQSAARQALARYFDGDLTAIDSVETATGGTPFQRQVWAALRHTKAGAPESYGALAQTIGRAKAVRAVGLANGANPVAIVVPCHRIIGSSGALTGYGGGLARKQWLLAHEKQRAQG
jgi:methylated-DNA-[protein]-cysteine S-methyltransferase